MNARSDRPTSVRWSGYPPFERQEAEYARSFFELSDTLRLM